MPNRKAPDLNRDNPPPPAKRATGQQKPARSSRSAQEAEYRELAIRIDQRLDELTARADRMLAKS